MSLGFFVFYIFFIFEAIVNLNDINMILGVSGWLSSKLGWSVGFIRIAFVVLLLAFGTGLGLYLVLWLVKLLSK